MVYRVRVRVRVTYFRVTRELQTRCKPTACIRVRLGQGSHVHFTYSAHARHHMRAARFCVAVDVRTFGLGLGLALGLRILGLRVSCKRAAKKRRAYASGSGGVRMYTSHTRHMRVTTCVQLDSGLQWIYVQSLGLGLGLGLRILEFYA